MSTLLILWGHCRTVRAARKAGAAVVQTQRGRARQMNAGAAAACGGALCFVHADSTPPDCAVVRFAARLQSDVCRSFVARAVVGGCLARSM